MNGREQKPRVMLRQMLNWSKMLNWFKSAWEALLLPGASWYAGTAGACTTCATDLRASDRKQKI